MLLINILISLLHYTYVLISCFKHELSGRDYPVAVLPANFLLRVSLNSDCSVCPSCLYFPSVLQKKKKNYHLNFSLISLYLRNHVYTWTQNHTVSYLNLSIDHNDMVIYTSIQLKVFNTELYLCYIYKCLCASLQINCNLLGVKHWGINRYTFLYHNRPI